MKMCAPGPRSISESEQWQIQRIRCALCTPRIEGLVAFFHSFGIVCTFRYFVLFIYFYCPLSPLQKSTATKKYRIQYQYSTQIEKLPLYFRFSVNFLSPSSSLYWISQWVVAQVQHGLSTEKKKECELCRKRWETIEFPCMGWGPGQRFLYNLPQLWGRS